MKYLHTMLRVGNLDRSLHFYCNVLNFELINREEHPEGKFTLAFLRSKVAGANPSGTAESDPQLELTYNWGVDSYELGGAYGHLAFGVDSIEAVQLDLQKAGLDLSWGPSSSPSGRSRIAFIKDPDGYAIELIERKKE